MSFLPSIAVGFGEGSRVKLLLAMRHFLMLREVTLRCVDLRIVVPFCFFGRIVGVGWM